MAAPDVASKRASAAKAPAGAVRASTGAILETASALLLTALGLGVALLPRGSAALLGSWPPLGPELGPYVALIGMSLALSGATIPVGTVPRRLGDLLAVACVLLATAAAVEAVPAAWTPWALHPLAALGVAMLGVATLLVRRLPGGLMVPATTALAVLPTVVAATNLTLVLGWGELLLPHVAREAAASAAAAVALGIASALLCAIAWRRAPSVVPQGGGWPQRAAALVAFALPLAMTVAAMVASVVTARIRIESMAQRQQLQVAAHAAELTLELLRHGITRAVVADAAQGQTADAAIGWNGSDWLLLQGGTMPAGVAERSAALSTLFGALDESRADTLRICDQRVPARCWVRIGGTTTVQMAADSDFGWVAQAPPLEPPGPLPLRQAVHRGSSGELGLHTVVELPEAGLWVASTRALTPILDAVNASARLLIAPMLVVGVLGALGASLFVRPLARRLTESRSRLEALLENIPAAVLTVDGQGHLVAHNPQAVRLIGGISTPRDVHGPLDALHEAVAPPSADGRSSQFPLLQPARLHGADGRERDVEIRTHPIPGDREARRVVLVQDVTRRNRAEAELRREEAWRGAIVESTADGICAIDARGGWTIFNPAAAALLGLPPAATDRAPALPEDDATLEPLRRLMLTVLHECHTVRGELPLRTAAGTSLQLDFVASPLRQDGATLGAVLAFRDVAEKRLAEQRLRASEMRYRALADSSEDLVARLSADGRFVEVSATSLALLGEEPAWLVGTELRRAVGDEAAAAVLGRGPRGSAPHRIEVQWLRRDGTSIWLELRWGWIDLPESSGGPEIMLAAAAISSRKDAESALRFTESMLRRAEEIGRIGSWHLDLRTGRAEWSKEKYRILGLPFDGPPDPALHFERVHPEDRERLEQLVKSVYEARTPHEVRYRLVVGDAVKWVLGRGEFEFDADGTATAWTGSIQDITWLHAREEELLQSRQRVRELAAREEGERESERTRLAREVHDELGQHLTVMRLAVRRMELQLDRPATERQHLIDDLKQQIDEVGSVVRGLVSRLRPAALEYGLAAAVDWLVSEFARRNAIQVHTEVELDGVTIPAELANTVFRALQESLNNVARHAQAGEVTVSLQCGPVGLEMRVTDDGQGFDPEQVRHMRTFGLMGMRERALAAGGTLRIHSHPGQGTAVALKIPLQPQNKDES